MFGIVGLIESERNDQCWNACQQPLGSCAHAAVMDHMRVQMGL